MKDLLIFISAAFFILITGFGFFSTKNHSPAEATIASPANASEEKDTNWGANDKVVLDTPNYTPPSNFNFDATGAVPVDAPQPNQDQPWKAYSQPAVGMVTQNSTLAYNDPTLAQNDPYRSHRNYAQSIAVEPIQTYREQPVSSTIQNQNTSDYPQISSTSFPSTTPQPRTMTNCDGAGCWDTQGTRYNRAAGNTYFPSSGGSCQSVGDQMQCN